MNDYSPNSVAAAARVVIMCLFADGNLDDSELDLALLHRIQDALSISADQFTAVLKQYLEAMLQEDAQQRINVLSPKRVNAVLDAITEPDLRLRILALSLSACKGDHALNDAELALFQHIMQHWRLDLTDLEIESALS